MLHRRLLAFGVLALIVPVANAQDLHVYVVYTNDRSAGLHLRVRLMNGSGSTPVSENFTNDQGRTDFTRVPLGVYHVIVTGEGIEETDSGVFEVDPRKTSQDLFITVRRSNEANSNEIAPGSPSVAVVDLNVPASARKELDKANDAMAREDWTKALQRLNRAVSIYPQYALAYNNLGVVYGRMNDPERERKALEKAIELNDHFVPALVNLAKLCFQNSNSARAEALLTNANRAEPNNAGTMTLLAQAQLLNKNYDDAVTTARNVHVMPHQSFAVVHYIAARAFEHENRLQDGLAELQIFLTEEPLGARADHVREEIVRIQHARP